MKEIKLLESWADSIVNEKVEDRPLARSQDIQYQASRKYPDRSPEQALQLYVSDKMQDNERMDLEQNKLINAQKRENEKLRRSLSDLATELDNHEKTAMDTEKEVQRLRDLSAKLKPASDVQQAAVKASQEQVQRMLSDLESLRSKPGMDPDKYNELKDQIEKARQGQSTGPQIQELQKMLNALDKKQEVDDDMFQKLSTKLQSLETLGKEKIGGLEAELEKKEQRYRDTLINHTRKIAKWGNDYSRIEKKLNGIEQRAEDVLNNVQAQSDEVTQKINKIAARVRQITPASVAGVAAKPLSKRATVMRDKVDQDEVYQAIAANQPISGEELTGQETDNGNGKVARASAVKSLRGLRMNEELEGSGTGPRQDNIETHLIPDLIEVYKRTYPVDLKRWSTEQLREIMRRTIDGSLLLDAEDVEPDDDEGLETLINKYLAMCRNWLRKTKPANPELPGIPQEPPAARPATNPSTVQQAQPGQSNWPPGPPGTRSMTESLVMSYTKQLNKLTGGF